MCSRRANRQVKRVWRVRLTDWTWPSNRALVVLSAGSFPAAALPDLWSAGLCPVRRSRRIEEKIMTKTNTVAKAGKTRPKSPATAKARSALPAAKAPTASKSDTLIALLSAPEGASIETLMKASGWQAHSVRGFLAGACKKKLGTAVSSEKTDGGRVYRVATAGTL